MNNTQMNIDKTQNTSSFSTADTKKKRRKIRIKPTKDGMLALLALVLITALVVTALAFACKGIVTAIKNAQSTEDTTDPNNGQTTLPWNHAYTSESINTAVNLTAGDLILVNKDIAYPLTETINSPRYLTSLYGYDGHGTYYVIPDSNTKISSTIAPSLKQMIVDMVDANATTLGTTKDSDRLYITGAYRDTELQTTLNTNNPSVYPEVPGYSEHHTGLAIDLKVMSKGATISLRDTEYQWLEEHCVEYGFVFRYNSSNPDMNEPYHLRYVGVAHATYMTENNLSLEDYLERLRTDHKYEQTPLEITANEKEYLVYYVPANTTEGEAKTTIYYPPASEGTYSISGDNMNGFIITVEKTAK